MPEPTIEDLQTQIMQLKEENEKLSTQFKSLSEQSQKDRSDLDSARKLNSKLINQVGVPDSPMVAEDEEQDTIEKIVDDMVGDFNKRFLAQFKHE